MALLIVADAPAAPLPVDVVGRDRLVSLADFRLVSGDTTTPDARLGRMLEQATSAVQRAARQRLVRATSTVTLSSDGSSLVLPQRPVIEVTALSAPGADLTLSHTVRGDTLHRGDPDTSAALWPELVTVTYVHGFDVCPGDLEALVCAMVERGLANPTGSSQESVEDYSRSFGSSSVAGVGLTEDESRWVRRTYGRTAYTTRLR